MLTAAFAGSVTIEVVGHFQDPFMLGSALPAAHADLIVVGAGPYATDMVARQCLSVAPHLTIVSLTRGGRDAVLYRLALSSTTLEDVSPGALIGTALRSASTSW